MSENDNHNTTQSQIATPIAATQLTLGDLREPRVEKPKNKVSSIREVHTKYHTHNIESK